MRSSVVVTVVKVLGEAPWAGKWLSWQKATEHAPVARGEAVAPASATLMNPRRVISTGTKAPEAAWILQTGFRSV
jgi:hypothetical protein